MRLVPKATPVVQFFALWITLTLAVQHERRPRQEPPHRLVVFFTNDLPQFHRHRLLVDMSYLRVVDEGLVVASASRFDDRPKVVQHRVVQADRDLGLSWSRCDHSAALPLREVDVAIGLSSRLAHI